MLFRCLLVLLIVSVPRVHLKSSSIGRYFCDSKNKISETLDLKTNFKRFLQYEEQLYFVFKKRIIFGRQPLNDKDADATSGSSLVLFNLYQQENVDEKELTEIQIPKGYKVFGYYNHRQKSFILEDYWMDRREENKAGLLLPYGLQLSFKEVLAERRNKINRTTIERDFKVFPNVKVDLANIKYIHSLNGERNYKLVAQLSYSNVSHSNVSQPVGKYRNKMKIFYSFEIGIHLNVIYQHDIYDLPDLRWFVAYERDQCKLASSRLVCNGHCGRHIQYKLCSFFHFRTEQTNQLKRLPKAPR